MTDRWYAMRAVYEHGREDDGTGVFCERILLFQAPHAEGALEQAEQESARYLELPGYSIPSAADATVLADVALEFLRP